MLAFWCYNKITEIMTHIRRKGLFWHMVLEVPVCNGSAWLVWLCDEVAHLMARTQKGKEKG